MSDRITKLKAILDADPNDAFCLYGLALEYAKLGQTEAALASFDKAIQVDPMYCYAYFHKAKCQEQAGDTDGAIATLTSGLHKARASGDAKAISEIASYLDELTP
jgi:tetratricopeptide (TPR) repeat protein